MDVQYLKPSNQNFRLLYDVKGMSKKKYQGRCSDEFVEDQAEANKMTVR